MLGIQIHPEIFVEGAGASSVGADGGRHSVACGDEDTLGGFANGLNLSFRDIHVTLPDPSMVVEEIYCGLHVFGVLALKKYVIYEDMLCGGFVGRGRVCSHEVSEKGIEV